MYTVAKLRLNDVVKKERERAARKNGVYAGKMTVGDAMAAYRSSVEINPDIKASSRKARIDGMRKIEKSWPSLARMDIRKVTPTKCRKWVAHYRKNGTGFTPQGSKTPNRRLLLLRPSKDPRMLGVEAREILVSNADDTGSPCWDMESSYDIVSLQRVLQRNQGGTYDAAISAIHIAPEAAKDESP